MTNNSTSLDNFSETDNTTVSTTVSNTIPDNTTDNSNQLFPGISTKSNEATDEVVIDDTETINDTDEINEKDESECSDLVTGEIVDDSAIPSELINPDDTPDELIESDIDTEDAIHEMNDGLFNATSTSEALELVGTGIKVGGVKLRIPHLPKTRGRKTGIVGCPVHSPTDAMRKYVFDAMCQGYTQGSVAHNLRIARMTLVKHYSYELQLAEDAKDTMVDGVLLRNACRSETDKGYQKSLEFYYKRHGKVQGDNKQVAGDIINNNNFIVVPTVVNNKITKGEIDSDIPAD